MAEDRKLIGYFSEQVAAPYGGTRVYARPDGSYITSNGKGIEKDVLKQLVARGLLLSAAAGPSESISDMSPFIPERVDPKATEGVVYIRDREKPVARVSYYARVPYEGQLVYRSNLDTHFVTEMGVVLDTAAMQSLGEGGHLLVPTTKSTVTPYSEKSYGNMMVHQQERFKRRQHFSMLATVALVIVVLAAAGYAYSKGMFTMASKSVAALNGSPSDPAKSAKGLGEAEAAKNRQAAEVLEDGSYDVVLRKLSYDGKTLKGTTDAGKKMEFSLTKETKFYGSGVELPSNSVRTALENATSAKVNYREPGKALSVNLS